MVGTAARREAELARTERLLEWADELWERRRWSACCRLIAVRRGRSRVSHPEVAGSYAIRALPRMCDETHAQALALVDELIATGSAHGSESEYKLRPHELSAALA